MFVLFMRSWHENMLQLKHVKETCAEEPCIFSGGRHQQTKNAKIGGDLIFRMVYEKNKAGV